MILDYQEFKKGLSLYIRYKKQYQKYCEMIEGIDYDLSKIPSMFPETTLINGKIVPLPKAHGDPKVKELYRLELIDLKAKYERVRDEYFNKYKEVDDILCLLPNELYKIVVSVYIKKEGIEKTARDHNYSKAGLAYRIDKELKMFFENLNFERFERKP